MPLFFHLNQNKKVASNRFNETMNVIVALTLSVQIPDKAKKLTYIFIFKLLCGGLKAF